MAEKTKGASTDRRSFLKLAGLGSVAGGAALAAGTRSAEAVTAERPDHKGYRETDHVRTFYKSARF